ncbi:MAG: molybdenum cofactor biosysynthesis protein [Crocinitomix sp.]|nr:molybdenum cofactor biosysynthesis protein [Crocinitomix sp.]
MGKVIGIATCNEKGAAMVVNASANVTMAKGIGDDYRGALADARDRQVSIMSKESWDLACQELGSKLHWTMRKANLMISGIDLENSTGSILKIGDFFLEITGPLRVGSGMEQQYAGLKKALTPDWRSGVTAKVVQEGIVHEDDEVLLGDRD